MNDLERWLRSPDRKPLVLRGARQVRKTWVVRELAKRTGKDLLEINFERDPRDSSLFSQKDPAEIVRQLEARLGRRIAPETSLLFLDEIQAAPHAFANLRWFAEDMPQLPVITAGSLLDFVLADHSFSMPVGRIGYLYMDAMTFEEFLAATGNEELVRFIAEFVPGQTLSDSLHSHLLSFYREFVFVGGMPAAVASWTRDKSPVACAEVHHNLLAAYRDDFHKYKGRIPVERLSKVFDAVPRELGRKFVYSRVSREESTASLKHALDLLVRARVCTCIKASHGTGIPLGGDLCQTMRKVIHMDVGLVTASLGLSPAAVQSVNQIAMVNNGAIFEQSIGQALRCSLPRFMEPELFYWIREKRGSEAEVDYLVQCGTRIVPIEVKAGKTGALKSLHLFMSLRGLPLAVRFNCDLPSITPVDVRTTSGQPARYTLLSLPFYLSGQLRRLVDEVG
jgi:predicted AAA+ superfamily ATPase